MWVDLARIGECVELTAYDLEGRQLLWIKVACGYLDLNEMWRVLIPATTSIGLLIGY